VYWDPDAEQPKCNESGHEYRRFEIHRHRDVVLLPDGTEVTAVSFDPDDPYAREETPNYGLYLDPRWQPPWPHGHVSWPDFGGPDDAGALLTALASLLERARGGERVELGCVGGHGRTGTALACLAILAGLPLDRAVTWVRARYCSEAIETAAQERFVASISLKGAPRPNGPAADLDQP
jgi:hypothetical protein